MPFGQLLWAEHELVGYEYWANSKPQSGKFMLEMRLLKQEIPVQTSVIEATNMPKKKLADMVFQRIAPPDEKANITTHDLCNVMVRRLGLKRKEGRADHAMLLHELVKYRRENIPVAIDKIAQLLSVSQSQAYEEIRKWRTLGLIEFVKIPQGAGFIKGYMLAGQTTNRLLDKVEANFKAFMRRTRRIAKDFDDMVGLEAARAGKGQEKTEETETEAETEATAEEEENG